MALQPFRSSAYWLFDRVLVYLMSCATNSICLRRMLPTQSKPCVQKLLITFTSHFPTSSLDFLCTADQLTRLVLTIFFAIWNTLHFWSSISTTFLNLFISSLDLTNFFPVVFYFISKSDTNGFFWLMHYSLGKNFTSFKNILWFIFAKQ